MATHGLPPAGSATGGPPPLPEGVPALRIELRDRRITDATPELAALVGCDLDALVGRALSDLWTASERPAIEARFDDVVLLGHDAFGALALVPESGSSVLVDVDARFDYRGGQRIDVSVKPLPPPPRRDNGGAAGSAAPDDGGGKAGAEDTPDADHETSVVSRVMTALAAAGAAALYVTSDNRVTGATPAAGRLLGTETSQLRGRGFDKLFDLPEPAEGALIAARLGRTRQTVLAGPTDDGAPLVLEWVPGHRPDAGYVIMSTTSGTAPTGDTERLRFQAQLVSHVAHDLRDAAASVYCGLRTLVDVLPPDSPEGETAGSALEESRRVNEVIDEVLAVSRPGRLRRVELELNQVIGDTVKRYRSRAAGASVEIRENLVPGVSVAADRSSLERAFGNLFDNALEATPHYGTLTVTSTLEDRACPGVRVSVTDTGIGIKPELRPNIFEPFVTGKDDGSGLGLAITRRVVLDHGGQIDCDSLEGRGTTFHVWLPRVN